METRVLKAEVSDGNIDFPGLKEAARCLAEGGIVAFPTETVYGLGVNLDITDAVQRLYDIKGRPGDKPFTLHISSREDLKRYVTDVPGRAVRLMRRFWPGPLTIVFSAGGGTMGVRLPANSVATKLIGAAGVPVGAPSANLSGDEPAWNAEQVISVFSGKIDMIIDGGPAQLRQASTVVSVAGNEIAVLREGIIGQREIERVTGTRILFVCGGNSCRSPMAEAISRRLLAESYGVPEEHLGELGFQIGSAGTSAFDGGRPSDNAVEALRNMGFGPPHGTSARITPEMVNFATNVFVMTESQRSRIIDMVPEAHGKVELLDPDGHNIEDPIGCPVSRYEQCAEGIKACLERRLREI